MSENWMLFNPFDVPYRVCVVSVCWLVVIAIGVALRRWKIPRWRMRRRARRIQRAMRRCVQEFCLLQIGLRLTKGKQTPDEHLLDYQRAAKATANAYGFKVEHVPGWDESQLPGWDKYAKETGARPRCPSEEYPSTRQVQAASEIKNTQSTAEQNTGQPHRRRT